MQPRHLTLAIAAVAIALGGAPAPAQPGDDTASLSAAAKKPPVKKRMVRGQRDTRQVACTVFGCQRIPRNCRPTAGYNWWTGEPTGFDVIVCR